MTTTFNIRRNVIVSTAAFAINLLLVFFSYKLIIALNGLATLGLWSTLMSWIYIIRLGDVGIGTAVMRFVALCAPERDGSSEVRRYIDTALLLNGVLFALLALIGFAIYSWKLMLLFPTDVDARELARSLLPTMFVGFFLSNLSSLVLGGLTGLHQGYLAALISLAGTITQFAIVLTLLPRIGLAGMAWAQVGQHCLILLVGWCFFLNKLQHVSGSYGPLLPSKISRTALREMLGFSLKAQFSSILNGLIEPFSKIVVGRIGGLEVLGTYEMVFKAVSLPRNVIVSAVQATVPALTRLLRDQASAAEALFRKNVRMMGFAAPMLILGTIAGAPILSLLMLHRVDATLWGFAFTISIGFAINMFGAPAYLLGPASGHVGWNIVSSILGICIVGIGAIGLAPIAESWAGVISASAALAIAALIAAQGNIRMVFHR